MTRSVRVLAPAQRDLQRIYDYVAREAPTRADPVIDDLLDAIESLSSAAERCARPRDPVLRERGYRLLVHAPYLVFFKTTKQQVRVHRVLHHKQAYRHLL